MRILMLLCFLLAAGCVTPCHKACDKVLAPNDGLHETTLAQRNRIHVFVINGNEPFGRDGLSKLSTHLNESGFAKVNVGGLVFRPYFQAKIRQAHRDDPDARFILIGYGFGAAAAEGMAAALHGEGVPIEAIVALAPQYLPFMSAEATPVRRIVIRNKAGAMPLEMVESGTIFLASNDVASDEAMHHLVADLLNDACAGLPAIVDMPPSVLALIDDPAPLPSLPESKPVRGILTNRPK